MCRPQLVGTVLIEDIDGAGFQHLPNLGTLRIMEGKIGGIVGAAREAAPTDATNEGLETGIHAGRVRPQAVRALARALPLAAN